MAMVVPRARRDENPFILIFITGFFAALIIPGVIIFLNYWKQSVGRVLRMTDNSIQLIHKTGDQIIGVSEIESVTVCKQSYHRLPWAEFEYLTITSAINSITIPSFIVSFDELIKKGFLREIPNGELIETQSYFPKIQE